MLAARLVDLHLYGLVLFAANLCLLAWAVWTYRWHTEDAGVSSRVPLSAARVLP